MIPAMPSLPEGARLPAMRFHHVGVACRDLDAEEARLAPLGYAREGEDFADPIQGVRGRFLGGQQPRLELLAEDGTRGVLAPWLQSNVKLYHLAYEVADLDATLAAATGKAARGRTVVRPVPAVAFAMRRIAFVLFPNMLLVEFIERPEPSPDA